MEANMLGVSSRAMCSCMSVDDMKHHMRSLMATALPLRTGAV